jgi:hypothetical protein
MDMDRSSKEVLEDHETTREGAHAKESFARRAAVLVGVLAALLAIGTLIANQASEDTLLSQELATDTYNEYQADSLKQRIGNDNSAVLTALNQPGPAAAAKKDAEDKGALKAPLLAKARAYEHERDVAHSKHRSYQLAEGAFQLGIVLVSISIVARVAALSQVGGVLGAVGLLLLLNGALQVVHLPGR